MNSTTGAAELPEALPRYREYMHLRTTGAWSDGVPAWAKDYSGLMNDMTAAHAVIEELYAKVEALSAAQAGAPAEAPLPLLVRDIAADLNTTPIQVCKALAELGFGGHSVNMAVTPQMARSLRSHFAAAPQPNPSPAPAQPGQEGERVRDERDEFEKVFPLPYGCIRVGDGYASTGYSNWAAHTHCERFQGWKARAARAAPQPATADAVDAARMDATHAAIYRWIIANVGAAARIMNDWCEDGGADTDELHDALAARTQTAKEGGAS